MTVPEQEANRSKCLDGTRVDLLQRIREWASSSDSPNIFLLTRIAGTGKSTIARTVAEEFKTKKSLDVTYSLKGERQIRVRSQAVSSGQLLTILRGTIPLSLNASGMQPSWLNGRVSHLQIFYSRNCYTTHFLRQFNWVPRIQFLSCWMRWTSVALRTYKRN